MTKPIARDTMYWRRVFDAEAIELCVRWYITYRLSHRDLVAIITERGIQVAHTTILCASMTGFKSFANAAVTIAGIELAHRTRKRLFNLGRTYRRRRGWSLKNEWAIALAQMRIETRTAPRARPVRKCTRTHPSRLPDFVHRTHA